MSVWLPPIPTRYLFDIFLGRKREKEKEGEKKNAKKGKKIFFGRELKVQMRGAKEGKVARAHHRDECLSLRRKLTGAERHSTSLTRMEAAR